MTKHQNTAPQLAWYKSSYSNGDQGNCIEVAVAPAAVHVRDSKDTTRPAFQVTPATWTQFLGSTTR
ncbi:DUF397 domain-containing protein [Streptomyces sp. NPDC088768]|uniref:DUF397 domain-containing protein n=1 Tax=Streptomyces sp. NPDC088768 TaxID=3365894 RepID=UPI00382708FA